MSKLPPFDPATSDGCSVPRWMRHWIVKPDSEADRACCIKHDEAYYYGGTLADRRRADSRLFACWLLAGMHPLRAFARWVAVRIGGHPSWRVKGVSWSYGDQKFCYQEPKK